MPGVSPATYRTLHSVGSPGSLCLPWNRRNVSEDAGVVSSSGSRYVGVTLPGGDAVKKSENVGTGGTEKTIPR